MIRPITSNRNEVKQVHILNLLIQARDRQSLAIGIKEVWKKAMAYRGSLLVLEKNYKYITQQGSGHGVIYKAVAPQNKFSYIKDPLDEAIEKVLENGGDVEFVENGVLNDYQQIALI